MYHFRGTPEEVNYSRADWLSCDHVTITINRQTIIFVPRALREREILHVLCIVPPALQQVTENKTRAQRTSDTSVSLTARKKALETKMIISYPEPAIHRGSVTVHTF